jgi:hypothetical protein
MGNPSVYYKRALQYLAHCLAFEDGNFNLAKELYFEESEERLERFILEKKLQYDERLFFYNAGRACQVTFDEAHEEGCDAMNASIGGVVEFEYLIGIREDD